MTYGKKAVCGRPGLRRLLDRLVLIVGLLATARMVGAPHFELGPDRERCRDACPPARDTRADTTSPGDDSRPTWS